MYTALARRCTRSVHAVNGRVQGTYNAVHTGRKDGRLHGRLHGRKHGRVHGHGRTMYMARARPCTNVHGHRRPCTDCAQPPSAVYKLCTRPYTGHTHGPSLSRTRPCTQPVRGKTRPGTRLVPDRVRTVYMAVHGPCTVYTYTAVYTAVFTAREHGRVRTLYTAVHGPSMTRTRPCTRSCTCTLPRLRPVHSTRPVNGRVLPMDTAVFTARVRGRVPCTCTCLWPVYTAVHGRVQTAYRPCTWSIYDTNAAAGPARPCLQPMPFTRPFTACTDRVHHDTVHSRHRKS